MTLNEINVQSLTPTRPFLKWAGGKRWLAGVLAGLLGNGRGRHIEPFVGSGACFFQSSAATAILADSNPHLMACFRIVRDRPEQLIRSLSRLNISIDTFDRLRHQGPINEHRRAVRLLYLNRTAFNGLYRVNREGRFNVPFGCKSSTALCDRLAIRDCSLRLANVELPTADFRKTLRRVRKEDRVYLDPPYTVMHNNNSFRRYNERIFSWHDQCTLASIADSLARGGTRVVVTNALHSDVIALYSADTFTGYALSRPTNMAASTASRGTCTEFLAVSRSIKSNTKTVLRILENHLSCKIESLPLRKLQHC